jgi:eukaryotic-like serine/threonine-protein kinase
LTALAHSGRVWVLVTLRADLYGRCADLPQTFRDLLAERGGVFTVVGPRPPEVAQMIQQPAAMAGVSFERRGDPEEGLDEVLRDAAAEHPSVLPLLEFTLDELWKRCSDTRMLRFSDYDDLGGLHGALRQRADEEFAQLPQSARDGLDQLLSAVVRIDPSDERLIVESRVPSSRFDGTPCQALIGAFTQAHLLVADPALDGTPVIGLAHEALLREWPPAFSGSSLTRSGFGYALALRPQQRCGAIAVNATIVS